MSAEDLKDIEQEYMSGKTKRKLAFLDTLIFAMDVQKDIDLKGTNSNVLYLVFDWLELNFY